MTKTLAIETAEVLARGDDDERIAEELEDAWIARDEVAELFADRDESVALLRETAS